MRLPNAERAFISAPKLTGYLLSAAHPRGRGKALFFKRFGFDLGAAHLLEQSLLQHARKNEILRTYETPHGTKYEIEGPLLAPDGRTPMVRSVWIIEAGGAAPHFVTAFPASRRRG
jgi:hypothetical protein